MYNILVRFNRGFLILSKRLKTARNKAKLTQEELGKKVNTTKGTISNYENGHSTPSNDMLLLLADVLNTTTDYLLGRENNKLSTNALDKEYEEFESFTSDPNNRIHFREMAESPEEMREKLWDYWDLLKKARNNKL
jgi:transcriptional regulator with XRE-family HTH domain